jgi:hypothetical protein
MEPEISSHTRRKGEWCRLGFSGHQKIEEPLEFPLCREWKTTGEPGFLQSRLPWISEHKLHSLTSLPERAADAGPWQNGGARRDCGNYSPAWGHFPSEAHSLSACGQAAALSWSQAADFSEQQLADLAALSAQQPLAQHSLPQQSEEQHSSVQPVVLQVPAWQQAASPVQQDPPEAQHWVFWEQQASPALGWALPLVLVMV